MPTVSKIPPRRGDIREIMDVHFSRKGSTQMRVLPGDEVRKLADANAWIGRLGLKLEQVNEFPLVGVPQRRVSDAGAVRSWRANLELVAALSALVPVLWGGGGAGMPESADKTARKMLIDRGAAAVQADALDFLMENAPTHNLVTAASEGSRLKIGREGEKGANPAIAVGQRFGRGAMPVYLVIDCVDKTTATAEGGSRAHSAVTALLVTESPAKALPDVRFLKDIFGAGGAGVDFKEGIEAAPEEVVEAICSYTQVGAESIWGTNLLIGRKERLLEPTESYLNLGVNFVTDRDGDVMSAIAAGLGMYGQDEAGGAPIHAMLAAAGGAAEGGLLLPVEWTGGRVLLGYASAGGFTSWQTRRNYVGNEEADIRAAGFDPFGTIRTTDIYQQPFADGVAVFGGISDNLWIPTLTGAQARSSRVTICALSIANDGTARVREFVLSYDNEAELRARLKPMIYDLQMLNSPSAVNVAVERLMRDSSSSASFFRQFIQEYYLVLIEERGGFRIDGAAFEAQVRAGRYSEADRAIIEAVRNKTPWIV